MEAGDCEASVIEDADPERARKGAMMAWRSSCFVSEGIGFC